MLQSLPGSDRQAQGSTWNVFQTLVKVTCLIFYRSKAIGLALALALSLKSHSMSRPARLWARNSNFYEWLGPIIPCSCCFLHRKGLTLWNWSFGRVSPMSTLFLLIQCQGSIPPRLLLFLPISHRDSVSVTQVMSDKLPPEESQSSAVTPKNLRRCFGSYWCSVHNSEISSWACCFYQ